LSRRGPEVALIDDLEQTLRHQRLYQTRDHAVLHDLVTVTDNPDLIEVVIPDENLASGDLA